MTAVNPEIYTVLLGVLGMASGFKCAHVRTEFPCEPEVDDLELVDVAASAAAERRRRRRRDFPVERRVTSRSRSAAADPVGVLLVREGRRAGEHDVLSGRALLMSTQLN